jgi:archaellum component FlaC/ribosome-associated translation inhibitor RaiA
MKEILLDVVAAGTLALSPHATEHPAIAENPSHIESLAGSEDLAPAQPGQSEPSAAPIDSIPSVTEVSRFTPNTSGDGRYDVAIAEFLDPDTLTFWWEAAGLSVAGIGSVITRQQLKKSLRRNHEAIKGDGWEAQRQLKTILDEANGRAGGLLEDDVLKLRQLIRKNETTDGALVTALSHTDTEFAFEHGRLVALKGRLQTAPHTKQVLRTTEEANKQAGELKVELERVKTAVAEIDNTIDHARNTVASLDDDLGTLTLDGWNVDTYKDRAMGLVADVIAAKTQRDKNYIDTPTEIAQATAAKALELKEQTAALKPRRAAADEAYGTQADRIIEAEAIAARIRGRYSKLQDTYHEGCLAGFEDLEEKLAKRLEALTSAHSTGSTMTGEHGKSVEAVDRSEELNASFDKAFKKIQTAQTNLQEREAHLVNLVRELPRQIGELSVLFDRAKILADSPDVEDATAAKILSHSGDVAELATNIRTAEGQKPNYLDIEQHHADVAASVRSAHTAATDQKQEMNDLRTNIPQLIDGYNNMSTTLRDFVNQRGVRVESATEQAIAKLQPYSFDMALDRKNLRNQEQALRKLVDKVYRLTRRAEVEADEDGPLLTAAKFAGGAALVIIGIDVFSD